MAQDNKFDLAQMDNENRIQLANIENQFKRDIASDENISNAWGLLMKEIGLIQNNPDLDSKAKRINIQNVLDGFSSFTNFWKKTTGGNLDVTDLIGFKITDVDETDETRALKKPDPDQIVNQSPSDY